MTRHTRTGAALLTLLTIGGRPGGLAARPAQAQGPPNTYADFPFNQGSLFYRPLKPKPRPKIVQRPVYTAPVQRRGYIYVQPGTNGAYQGANSFTARSYGSYSPQPRYYYPATRAYVQPYQAAPAAGGTAPLHWATRDERRAVRLNGEAAAAPCLRRCAVPHRRIQLREAACSVPGAVGGRRSARRR